MEDAADSGGSAGDRAGRVVSAKGSVLGDKRCVNGHVIDELWDLCPYCPSVEQQVRPRPGAQQSGRSVLSRGASPAAAGSLPQIEAPQHTVLAPRPVTVAGPGEPRWVVGWLVAVEGRMLGNSFPLRTGRNVIGRSAKSDVVIPDEQVSSHHADIIYRSDERRFILMDHQSTNGTFVNESEVSPRMDLVDRDTVRIGRQRFIFVALCDERFGWDQIEQRQ